MSWFESILNQKREILNPPDGLNALQEKQWRLSMLTEDEYKAFQWFRQGYTSRWTAETMLLGRKAAKKMFDSIYSKLCVADAAEVSRVYRTIELSPDELPKEEDPPSIK
ncbi:hypothetical protein MASR2M70_19000 [Bacillota bacterium]